MSRILMLLAFVSISALAVEDACAQFGGINFYGGGGNISIGGRGFSGNLSFGQGGTRFNGGYYGGGFGGYPSFQSANRYYGGGYPFYSGYSQPIYMY